MKTYKVDLDYESFLFDPRYSEDSPSSQKIIKEFEYVFFFINQEQCILKNVRSYEKNYLNKLKNLGLVIPELNPAAVSFECWWGNRHDYNLEKKLNSKITSAEIAQEHGWGFYNGAIVSSSAEVESHIQKFPDIRNWIIKRPHGFSGIGHYQFSASNLNKFILNKVLESEVLLEPLHQRVFDIGTTFVIDDGKIKKQFMVENMNSPQGGFKGGVGSAQPEEFKKYIFEKYQYSLDELEKITLEIAQTYLAMGAIKNIQIDSFIYLENGELKLYPLVEVNYRKTMGLMIQCLAEKFSECKRIEWIIKTQKEINEDPDFYTKNSELLRISPDGTHFQTYLKKIL